MKRKSPGEAEKPKRFDATMRDLFEPGPAAWLEFFGVAVPDPALAEVLDSNVSTISAETDKLLRRGGPDPVILHIEFFSSRDKHAPRRMFVYNTLATHRYKEPVWSVMVLLRPRADGPELTGEYEHQFPGRGRNVWFRFDVVRVWKLPPEQLLEAGLPLLPLAPVSNVTAEQLPAVLTGVARRLQDEAAPDLKKALWAATEILLGLNHSEERVKELTEEITTMILGIPGIEESSVYQGIFTRGKAEGKAEGRTEEAREILLGLGQSRLGQPDEVVRARIAAIDDADHLNRLIHRILQAATWEELLSPTDR